jgi:hypothetical protein
MAGTGDVSRDGVGPSPGQAGSWRPARDARAAFIAGVSDVRTQVHALDQAVFDAVADTPTPALDRFLVSLSRSADYSRLWLSTAAGIAVVGGARGRRARPARASWPSRSRRR